MAAQRVSCYVSWVNKPDVCWCVGCAGAVAALITEDFGLLQLYAESFQTGGALATYLKSYRAANKKKGKSGADSTADPPMSPAKASTVVMVTASALAAQVYPDSRFGSLHAKQLTGEPGELLDNGSISQFGTHIQPLNVYCTLQPVLTASE